MQIIEKAAPDALWITVQAIRARNSQMKYLQEEGFLEMGNQFVERHGNEVLHGPFAGMKYPSESARTRHIVPRLLGAYEMELHPIFEALTGTYDCVVDIGSAEGYYAVGLALLLGIPVHAFEADVRERRRTRRMSEINGVAHLVLMHGFCSRTDLMRHCFGRAFIMSDCEGYERALFDGEIIPHLRRSDLIIETHGEGTEALLLDRLAKTHRLRVFPCRERSGREFPEASFFGERSAVAVCELRHQQSWIWCESMIQAQDFTPPSLAGFTS